MRKGLLLLSAGLLLAAAPVALEQNENTAKFVRDGVGQVVVPFQSAAKSAEPAKPTKAKKSKSKKAKKSSKGKKSSKAKKKG